MKRRRGYLFRQAYLFPGLPVIPFPDLPVIPFLKPPVPRIVREECWRAFSMTS